MKKNLFLLVLLCVSIILSSCNKDGDSVAPNDSKNDVTFYRIPLDEALKNADHIFAGLEGELSRGKTRRLASVKILGGNTTASRSVDTDRQVDTAFYLVNYEGAGFALLSADRRLNNLVYAISEEGTLDLADTVENKGLAMYMQMLRCEVDYKLGAVNQDLSSRVTLPGLNGDFSTPYYETISIGIYSKKGPYNVNRKWDQLAPFNKYCYTVSGQQAPVGCVAVATGMIMAHHQWPNSMGGYSLNWSEINKVQKGGEGFVTGDDHTARLLSILGRSEYLDMSYGVNESGANSRNVPRTLRKLGYTCSEVVPFDVDAIVQHYESSNNPIYMRGNAGYDRDTKEYYNGHAWMLDGVLVIKYVYKRQPTAPEETAMGKYIYCNWGWKGDANGWYTYWEFLTTRGPEFTEIDQPKTNGSWQFFWNFEVIMNISR